MVHGEASVRRALRRAVALLVIFPLTLLLAAPAASQAAAAVASQAGAADPAGPEAAAGGRRALAGHARSAEALRRAAESVLGPMPAVASTPFFGLALLSAAALAADSDVVRRSQSPWLRAFREQPLVREARRYASWTVLLVLTALALVTYLANSGKVRGVAGKGLRLIEDGASFLLFSALAAGTLATAAPAAHPAAAAMGIAEVSLEVLTACGLAVGLAAMMVTRYALDLLIWLVPVPFIDFGFETLKKLFSFGFLALSIFAPRLAAGLALLLLVAALFASGWALRVLGFAFHVVLRPWMARLDPVFAPRLVEPRLLRRAAGTVVTAPDLPGVPAQAKAPADPLDLPRPPNPPDVELATDAVVLGARGLRKRQPGALLRHAGGLSFVPGSWLRRRRARPLAGPGQSRELVRALLWIELRVSSASGGPPDRFALSRAHDFARLRQLLDATDGGRAGAARFLYGGGTAPGAGAGRPERGSGAA